MPLLTYLALNSFTWTTCAWLFTTWTLGDSGVTLLFTSRVYCLLLCCRISSNFSEIPQLWCKKTKNKKIHTTSHGHHNHSFIYNSLLVFLTAGKHSQSVWWCNLHGPSSCIKHCESHFSSPVYRHVFVMLLTYNNALWCLNVPLPSSPSKHILLGDIRDWAAAPTCGTFLSNGISWQASLQFILTGFYPDSFVALVVSLCLVSYLCSAFIGQIFFPILPLHFPLRKHYSSVILITKHKPLGRGSFLPYPWHFLANSCRRKSVTKSLDLPW